MIKKQSGITLIFLIIIVIVLLILASITIKLGQESAKLSQDSIIESNLRIVKQAVLEEYSKKSVQSIKDIKYDGIQINNLNELNNIIKDYKVPLQKKDNPLVYYILQNKELKQMGIEIANSQEYLVDYETGEIWDVTNKVYSTGECAYLSGNSKIAIKEEVFDDDNIDIPKANESIEPKNNEIYWSLSKPKYETKTDLRPNGYTDEEGNTWGTGALIELKLTCNLGLRHQEYKFLYSWKSVNDLSLPNFSESVSILPNEGQKELTTTIYINSFSGKGKLYVKPASEYFSLNDSILPIEYRCVEVNLDNTPPKIKDLIYENFGSNIWGLYNENIFDQEQLNNNVLHLTKDISRICDDDSGIFKYNPDTEKRLSQTTDILHHSSAFSTTNFTEPDYMNSAYLVSQRMTSYRWLEQIENHCKYVDLSLATWNNHSIESNIYYLWTGSIERNVEHEIIDVIDNVGNVLIQPHAAGPIYVDTQKPIIDNITINTDESAQVLITDDYSGFNNENEDNIKNIKYTWLKNKEDEIDKENLKSISNDQTIYQLKSDLFQTYRRLVVNINPDSNKENKFLYVCLEGFEDIAHNKANENLISN